MTRILGLDFGLRRIGVAVSDPDRTLASPVEVYQRRSERLDADFFRSIVQEYRVDRIVVGLPLHGHGAEGTSAGMARDFGRWLTEQTRVSVVFFDERYSTVEAEELLRASGLRASQRKARRDMVAAQLLLQAYMDAGCPAVEVPAQPLDDSSSAAVPENHDS